MKILLTIIALLYVLNPYDLVTDFLPGWGWLDDLLVGLFLWWIYTSLKQSRQKRRMQRPHNTNFDGDRRNGQGADNRSGGKAPKQKTPDDPYATLGIDRRASVDDVKSAYRKLAAQYHPDKVAHLGQEFGELAEQRFKEIQRAYQQIMSERKG